MPMSIMIYLLEKTHEHSNVELLYIERDKDKIEDLSSSEHF